MTHLAALTHLAELTHLTVPHTLDTSRGSLEIVTHFKYLRTIIEEECGMEPEIIKRVDAGSKIVSNAVEYCGTEGCNTGNLKAESW